MGRARTSRLSTSTGACECPRLVVALAARTAATVSRRWVVVLRNLLFAYLTRHTATAKRVRSGCERSLTGRLATSHRSLTIFYDGRPIVALAMERISTTPGPRMPDAPARAVATRDAGLDLIRRVNRWLIAGAVAGTGVLSLAAAHAFHGRTVTVGAASSSSGSAAQPSQPSSSSPAQQSQPSSSSAGSGLQSPAQSPAPASTGSSAVVSGGS
jgi:hypothetical protein